MRKIALVESICARQMSYLGYQGVSDSGQNPSPALLLLDVLLGLGKKKIASIFSKSDEESPVAKRSAVLSRIKSQQGGHSGTGLVSRRQREEGL